MSHTKRRKSGAVLRAGQRTGAVIFVSVVLTSVLVAGASAATAAPDLCVSTNGVLRHLTGTATCVSDPGGNVAIAKGNDSNAVAMLGARNKAFAFGDNSLAEAYGGDGNTAVASGDDSRASAGAGDENLAIASGDDSTASALIGDGNTAIAATGGCAASATGGGQTDTC